MKTSKSVVYCFLFSLFLFPSFMNTAAQTIKTESAKAYNEAVKAIEISKNDLAITNLNKAIAVNSQFDIAYLLRGKCYLADGNKEKALKDFNQALTINASLGEGYACLAYYYLGDNNPQLAFENSNKAIFLNYKTANVYYYRGQARIQNADYSGAVADFTTAIDQNGSQPDFYHDRSLAKMQIDDYAGAERDIKKAIELRPNSLTYSNSYVYLLTKQKNYTQALNLLTELIAKNPDNQELAIRKADVKLISGDVKGAEADYRALVEKTSSSAAWTSLGNALLKQLKYKEAVDCFENAIQADSKYASAYLARGIALENLGDVDGACSDWKLAAEYGDSQAEKFLSDCK